uniref:Mannosyltransferase n=1 Tax=Ascaris lumbricoides TaxID=6252 RepID=A0A0M3IUV6_ASCLU
MCFLKIAKHILSPLEARYALFSYVTCWFVWYCAPRTLSNSLETALSLIALRWYPFGSVDRRCWPYMTIGAVTILIRPTAILLWVPLGFWHFMRSNSRCSLILMTCLPAVLPVLVAAFALDSLAYGKWTLSAWNFAKFNVFEGGSAHFGVHPWHWFFLQGIPSVLTVQLIPIIGGAVMALRWRRVTLVPLVISLFYIIFHSCLAHKEHRFLLPVIPLLSIYAGYFFGYLTRYGDRVIRCLLIILLLLVNIPLAVYTGLYHQIGPFTASDFIAKHAMITFGKNKHFNVLQLMPCYSMPQYSHMHGLNCTLRALDCSPNLGNITDFIDESDEFHSNPLAFIESNKDLLNEANYVVFYERIFLLVSDFILKNGFYRCARLFHAHFLTSNRQDNYIVIEYNCNGTTVEHPEYGEVIQLTGDQRQHIKDFLCKVGIVKEENCKIHGF